MKILLATDGSEHSQAAVDEIAQRPFPAGSQVRIISVVEPPPNQTKKRAIDEGCAIKMWAKWPTYVREVPQLCMEP